jgi:NitT/TauT family transport system substrate-binding protein
VQPIILNEPFRAVFYAPFYVAEARGLYARQGVEVRRDTAGDPARAADNLLEGRADVAWSGPMRVMLLRARDAACPLKSFAAIVMKDPFYLMGAAPRPGFATSDLAALRLGAVAEVPTPWWCLQQDIRDAGLDPDTLAVTLGPSMAENAAALRHGTLDVAQMFEPFASQVEDSGGAVWQAAADRGPAAYTALYATEARIAERGAEFAAMIRALRDALAWIADAEPAEIAATIAPLFPDLPQPLLARALGRYRANGIWTADPRFPRAAFDRLLTSMASAGQLPRLPSFEDCVDEAIVERALAE